LKNDVNVPSKSNKQFFVGILKDNENEMKIAGSGSASGSLTKRHGSADPDPDPHKNVTDPQRWPGRKTTFICRDTVYARLKNDIIVCSLASVILFLLHQSHVFAKTFPQLGTQYVILVLKS
jgi:hypothetical protein